MFFYLLSLRAESAHSSLKSFLSAEGCSGDLCTALECMGKMLRMQHSGIEESFERSKTKVDHRVNKPLLKDLWGFVSREALLYVTSDMETLEKGFSGFCDCTIKRTHGLPCRCEVDVFIQSGRCLPIRCFHQHWKQLSYEHNDNSNKGRDPHPLVDEFYRQLSILDNLGKKVLCNKFQQLLYPETSSMIPPKQKAKTKGRPSDRSTKRSLSGWEHQDIASDKVVDTQMSEAPSQVPVQSTLKKVKVVSPHLHKFPSKYHESIDNIVDVKSDGNCGFRALSLYKFGVEDNFILIRHDLISEMTSHSAFYIDVLGLKVYEAIKNSLFISKLGFAPPEKWLTLPDMGLVICNRYNVALVSLGDSESNCATYLPTRRGPSHEPKIWGLGFVDNCHWVQVLLNGSCQLPKIQCQWKYLFEEDAAEWEGVIKDR